MNCQRFDNEMGKLCPIREINIKIELDNTKIIKYFKKHPDNAILADIIFDSHMECLELNMKNTSTFNFLIHCYKLLIKQNLDEIIYEIIDGSNSFDEEAIVLASIEMNQYDLLDIIFNKGFDTNKLINVSSVGHFYYHGDQLDALTHAVINENLEMCKYLISKGACPFANDNLSFIRSCSATNSEFFDYFMEFDVPMDCLKKIFYTCCCGADYDKMKRIVEKGFDLNLLDQNFFDRCYRHDFKFFQFILDNGFEIKSNTLLRSACLSENARLVEFCLDYGMKPNNDIVNIVIFRFNVNIIKLFIKYNVDFSSANSQNQHNSLIQELEDNGLDRDVLLNNVINKLVTMSSIVSAYFV